MIKKICIIGFGSIGERHYKILKRNFPNKDLYIYSRRKLKLKSYVNNFNILLKINPDYFIVCTETSNHYKILVKFLNKFNNKIFLVEKPLFLKPKRIKLNNNKVYVGYNLRFHPLIQKIKKITSNKKFSHINSYCYSYLPNWRKRDYKKSYSAVLSKGGGVLYDLSHEIDYIYYLFGNFKIIYSFNNKISNLELNSKDFTLILGKTQKSTNINISLNYFSKFEERGLHLYAKNFEIFADLISNTLVIIKNNKKIKYEYKGYSIDNSYLSIHKKIFKNKFTDICDFKTGNKLAKLFSMIN